MSKLPSEWRFHCNHGDNIVLSNNGRTATKRVKRKSNSIVLANQPMTVNDVFEIRVDERAHNCWGWLPCGVVVNDSADLIELPDTARWGWRNADVFTFAVFHRGALKRNPSFGREGCKLLDLPVGTRVGVMVDSHKCLHLFINERDVACVQNASMPCYAFFDIGGRYKQLTALPIRHIQTPPGD